MGLMDILNGMQQGPRGPSQPTSSSSSRQGLSPMMMALIGLLAYKAVKGLGRSAAPAQPTSAGPTPLPPSGTVPAGQPSGGLGDILGGLFGSKPTAPAGSTPAAPAGTKPTGSLADMLPPGLGGVLGGAAAGTVLSGGLNTILKELQDAGHGKAAQSWVGNGPNQDIPTGDLAHALGSDTLDTISQQTGVGRSELLEGLRQYLPQLVDQLTPDGRVPTADEASRMV
jgi:uncharacterized protein YidB (DUF937 family)